MAGSAGGGARRGHSAAAHLIVFALVVATPLLLLVGALLYRSVDLERVQVEQRIGQVLEGLVADIDRDIDRQLALLETLSTSTFLAAEEWPAFYEQVKVSLRGRAFLVLVDAQGRQVINTYVPYGAAPPMTSNSDTLRRIQQTRRPAVSDLFTSQVVKQPIYTISLPILRGDEVRFIMNLALVPEDLRLLLQSQGLPPQWAAIIWDTKGLVMAHTQDHARTLGKAVPPGLAAQSPGRAMRTLGMDGEAVLAATGRAQRSNWGVAITVPVVLIDRQVEESVWFWGATILTVGALVVSLAFLFGRELTRPLAAATAAASALGRGEPFTIRNSRLSEVNAVNDALRRAQGDLERSSSALRESEEQLRNAAEAAQFGAHEYDVVNNRTVRSPQLLAIFGATAGDAAATFEAGLDFVHPDDREATRNRKQQILTGSDDRYRIEYRVRRRDGQVRWVMDRGRVVRDPSGRALRVIGVVLDITDLKEAEQRQHLLFDELNHRVKNTLSIVQSLAQQTLRTRPVPAEFVEAFSDRLESLSRAHSLLTREAWRGASLRDVVATALAAFIDEDRPIDIGGDPATVPASTTITLGLVLHELATNAAKYGALSVAEGRLSIRWSAVDTGAGIEIDLRWQEENGPAVAPPTRKGFGSRLLAGSAQQLDGKFEIDYAVEGVRARLRFSVPGPIPLSGELPFSSATSRPG
ncbi:hypothetical protein BH11PSE3_BH11PSE3_39990 [soil metagenome]